MKKRALGLLIALLLVTVGAATPTPDAATKTGVWQYRRTLTVYEKGGVSRKSYAIDLALSKSELALRRMALAPASNLPVFDSGMLWSA